MSTQASSPKILVQENDEDRKEARDEATRGRGRPTDFHPVHCLAEGVCR